MKKTRRNIYGRKYTMFGYILHLALVLSGTASFIVLLSSACESDAGGDVKILKVVVCLIVFWASVLLHNKIFE